MPHIAVKIQHKSYEALDIAVFELVRPDGSRLPDFSAGSHIDVQVPGGFVRQYSLCNDPGENHRYRIAVLRDPNSRGGSAAMHDALKQGDTLLIGEPRNHFPLVYAEHALLFAGGIGVTPLLAMAQRLFKIGSDFTMHYCARSKERTAFLDEIEMSGFVTHVAFHFDDGEVAQKLDLARALGQPRAGTHVWVCGPAGFIDFVTRSADQMGWMRGQMHLEYFGASLKDTAKDRAFRVKLESSGKVYEIAADMTVTQALNEHGIEIPVSCEQGVCGTCITRVLEGECDHRDLFFTDNEKAKNDQFTPCCSRAKSEMLVLDL